MLVVLVCFVFFHGTFPEEVLGTVAGSSFSGEQAGISPLYRGPAAAHSTSYRIRLLLRLMRLRARVALFFLSRDRQPCDTSPSRGKFAGDYDFFSLAHAPIGRHMTAAPWCFTVLKFDS